MLKLRVKMIKKYHSLTLKEGARNSLQGPGFRNSTVPELYAYLLFYLDRLKAKDIAYIGLREVDPEETQIIEDLDMHAFSMRHVDEFGVREVPYFNAFQTIRRLNTFWPENTSFCLLGGWPGSYFIFLMLDGVTLCD